MSVKVCHLTSLHPNNDVRIFVKECVSLSRAGFDVTLIAPGETDEMRSGVKIISIRKSSSRTSRMLYSVGEVFRKAVEVNADIYHFHDPELIPTGLKLKRLGKKVIYDVHEDLPRQTLSKYYIPFFLRPIVAAIVERYENYSAKKFDQIITVTPLLEKRFSKYNSGTVQVCNFPILTEFPFQNITWIERQNELCYIGNISKIRGIEEMLRAIENADIKLHLAGNFSPPSLRDDMMQLKGWSNVIEHGFIGREKIASLLSTCKIGLVLLHATPNYVHAFPVKLFEYMSAGIPIIASHFPLWKEIVYGNRCGICVDQENPDAIADAISSLMLNDDLAEQMGRNGRKAAEEKYNWRVEEKKLLDIYQRLS